jgi:hypothetical protein
MLKHLYRYTKQCLYRVQIEKALCSFTAASIEKILRTFTAAYIEKVLRSFTAASIHLLLDASINFVCLDGSVHYDMLGVPYISTIPTVHTY